MQKKHSDYKLNGKSVQELETRKYEYSKKTPVFAEALFNVLVEAGESRTPHLEYWIIHSDVLFNWGSTNPLVLYGYIRNVID